METRRAEAFSDGVFAVAITVLVFNLLPIGQHAVSYRLLLDSWPQYGAYVVSFLTIGIMWLNHHSMLSHVARVDRITLVINLFLLMGVVAVPFPTALVADHLGQHDAAGARVATVVYGLVMTVISVGYSGLWLYLAAHADSLAARPIRPPRQATLRFSGGLVGYVAGTLVAAFASSAAALVIYGLIAVYYLFEHLPEPGAEQQAGDSQQAGDGQATDSRQAGL
jgi:uncharacterized membrane protein